MKSFIKFAAIAAAALAIIGCEKDNNGKDDGKTTTPEVEYTENLEFTLEVTSTEADQAKIKVSHNGTTDDTWYGFATTETNVAAAITAKVAELTAEGDGISGLKKNKSTTVTLKNLEASTEYTYIVFAITKEGDLYGNSNSVKFTTSKAESEFTVNPAWTVEYTGQGEIQQTVYDHTISVTSTDQNKYFITAVTAEVWEEYGIKAIAKEEVLYMKEFIEYFNTTNGTNYTFEDLLFTGDGIDAMELDPGDWYALAIGVDDSSYEASGLYAVSEMVTIKEEEMTPEYAAWLGEWTFTDANGVSLNVTFEPKVNNKTYNMLDYDAPDLNDWPVEVTWFKDEGIWAIYPQLFGTFDFSDGSQGDIYFLGGQTSEEGFSLYTDVPIAIGGHDENGAKIVIGYSDEENGINVSLMGHFVVVDGQPYFWEDPAIYPYFPLTVTATEVPASRNAVAKKHEGVQKLTQMPRVFKTRSYGVSGGILY